jgi:hypothetical protein
MLPDLPVKNLCRNSVTLCERERPEQKNASRLERLLSRLSRQSLLDFNLSGEDAQCEVISGKIEARRLISANRRKVNAKVLFVS